MSEDGVGDPGLIRRQRRRLQKTRHIPTAQWGWHDTERARRRAEDTRPGRLAANSYCGLIRLRLTGLRLAAGGDAEIVGAT
jgi:hypothetical protein